MSFDVYYGLDNEIKQVPENLPYNGFHSVSVRWLGQSCGARFRTSKTPSPVVTSGIVMYSGKRFKEEANELQVIRHINTKNGPVTVVSHLFDKPYYGV